MRLRDYQQHAIHLWCRCGHSASLYLADLDPELTVDQVRARLRCSRCRRWGYDEIRIGWAGPLRLAQRWRASQAAEEEPGEGALPGEP